MDLNLKRPKNLFIAFLVIGVLIVVGQRIKIVNLFNQTFFSEESLVEEISLSGSLSASVLKSESLGGTNRNTRGGVVVSCLSNAKTPTRDKVIINEVAWMGTTESFSNEWIELKNISNDPVSISGWQFMDKDEQIKIIFPDSAEIPTSGLYLLERGEEAIAGVEADIIYAGNLRNSEEGLRLFNNKCDLVDEVLANPDWPAGNNKDKSPMERNIKDFSWYTSTIIGGTPGNVNSQPPFNGSLAVLNLDTVTTLGDDTKESGELVEVEVTVIPEQNFSPPPPFTGSQVLISEIMAGINGNAKHEFIELYNPASSPVDLSGWTLKKKSSTGRESSLVVSSRLESKIIPPGSYFLLVNSGGWTGSMIPDVEWPSSYNLAYTNNAISIYNKDGEVVDEVNWQEIPKGRSFERPSWVDDQFIIQISPNPQGSN
ncbi:MAG: lamin tail domain-containing protein [Patescibacteria group bacterium]|nr:lamin tail domain-containing protein [Patescibacteria group bacterium]